MCVINANVKSCVKCSHVDILNFFDLHKLAFANFILQQYFGFAGKARVQSRKTIGVLRNLNLCGAIHGALTKLIITVLGSWCLLVKITQKCLSRIISY